jgi:hypothetical protein
MAVVYRCYGAGDRLLYVGMTMGCKPTDAQDRLKNHSRSQDWWGEVVRVGVTEAMPRDAALKLERQMIWDERPAYNKPARPLIQLPPITLEATA